MAETILSPWSPFYIMTATSAATLTGLMFVVITLVSGATSRPGARDGTSAFSTPTVVHFGAALFVSAILCAPWTSLTGPVVILVLLGLAGVAYMVRVGLRLLRFTLYDPDLEDWICFAIGPFIAYVVILVGALLLRGPSTAGLYTLAAGVVLLMFIGIRNAWDVVTYIAIVTRDDSQGNRPSEK